VIQDDLNPEVLLSTCTTEQPNFSIWLMVRSSSSVRVADRKRRVREVSKGLVFGGMWNLLKLSITCPARLLDVAPLFPSDRLLFPNPGSGCWETGEQTEWGRVADNSETTGSIVVPFTEMSQSDQQQRPKLIWQFGVILIPKSAISSEGEALPASIPSEQQPAQGFEKQIDLILSPILSPTKSWSEQMQNWGGESGNDAYVCYTDEEKKVVEEIAFRLDARDISLDLIRMICTLAGQLSCVLLTADSEVLQPVESEMLAAIRNSTATKFIDDPVARLGATFVTIRRRQSQDTPTRGEKS